MSSSNSTPHVYTLPIVTIQASFPTAVNEVYSAVIPSDDVWISCYDHSPSDSRQSGSLHARVRLELDEEDREKVVFRVREGDVRIKEADQHEFNQVYIVSSLSLRVPPTKLLFPVQEYADPERSNPQKPHRITAFSLASDKSQFATGFLDGSVFLYPITPLISGGSPGMYPTSEMYSPSISTYTLRRQIMLSSASGLRAHRSIVNSLRFFPSSRVLLSSGADFTLQIYPAEPIPTSSVSSGPGQTSKRVSSVRALTSHTRSVTSTAMIGRGRMIMSASLDGTIRMWNVGSGEEAALVHSASGVGIGINQIFLSSLSAEADASPSGTLYAALNDGSFEVFKLDDSQKLVHEFRSEPSAYGALNAIAVSSSTAEERLLAVGSGKGVISVYDASSYASVIHFRRSDASIESLAFVPLPGESLKLGLVIATADGLPWVAELPTLSHAKGDTEAKVTVYTELAGGDVDAVRAVSVHTTTSEVEVWTAGDDGIVRRYVL